MTTAKNLIDIVQLGEGYQAEFKRTLPSKLKEVSFEEWVERVGRIPALLYINR